MNKIEITKLIASTAVGAGTAKIVNGIIKNNAIVKNRYDKIVVIGAGAVIGSMASEATKGHTDLKIDKAIGWYVKTFKKD